MAHRKGAFWVFFTGWFAWGDSFEPEVYEREWTLHLPHVGDHWHYIDLMHRNVDYSTNDVIVNGHTVGHLDKDDGKWKYQSIVIRDGILVEGQNNTFKIISRNASGGQTGNIDDFEVRNMILHFNYDE